MPASRPRRGPSALAARISVDRGLEGVGHREQRGVLVGAGAAVASRRAAVLAPRARSATWAMTAGSIGSAMTSRVGARPPQSRAEEHQVVAVDDLALVRRAELPGQLARGAAEQRGSSRRRS